jgi:hypothetical protein
MNQPCDCPCRLPSTTDIHLGVTIFNQNQTDLKLDATLHELFLPPLHGSPLAQCAVTLNALWTGGVPNVDWRTMFYGFVHRISNLQRLAQEIRRNPLPIPRTVLDQEVIPRSRLLLENILALAQANYYVFAAKFMHGGSGLRQSMREPPPR